MNDILTRLPEDAKKLYDDMQSGRVLGAANHIRMIGDILLSIATPGSGTDAERRSDVLTMSRFFQDTRGKSSYAVVTAINLMMRYVRSPDKNNASQLNETNREAEMQADFGRSVTRDWDGSKVKRGGAQPSRDETLDIATAVKRGIDEYRSQAVEHAKLITAYATRLARDMDTLIVFDYSSTVEAFIAALAPARKIYMPESRIIDGGRPFLQTFADAGHDVHFIPDAAMLTVLDECKGAFIGAETFYPDGTAFNTAGSDILAELCKARNIPYYVLTPLIKLDMRATKGIFKQPIAGDMTARLGTGLPPKLVGQIDFTCTELVGVPPAHVTAFVTEEGIIPTNALFAISAAYDKRTNPENERNAL